jgi:long-subunit fatty acid transport protein
VHPSHTFPRWCQEGERLCEPSSAPTDLPAPQRYDMVSSDLLVFYPTVGLAWEPLPGLSVGGHFQAAYGSFELALVAGTVSNKEDPDFDSDIKLSTRDVFTPTGILGVHWRALPFLELGASVRFGFTFHFEGDVEATLPESLALVEVRPNPGDITLDVPMPWVVRSGLRYVNRDAAERERFDLELDFVWESTGQVKVFDVTTDVAFDFAGTTKQIESLSQQHNWDDSWSLRLGGSYNIHDLFGHGTLILRAGGFYESAAAPAAFSRLDFLPFARYGVTAGVGLRWGRYEFGVGYAHIFHEERNVAPAGGDGRTGECQSSGGTSGCGSGVTQVLPIFPEDGRPVANGAFDVAIQIVTFGAAASFGGP